MLHLCGGVAEQVDLDSWGKRRAHPSDQRTHVLADSNAIGLLFFSNREDNCRLAVHPAAELAGRKGVRHFSDVADAHRAAALVRPDHHSRKLADIVDSRHAAHEPGIAFALGRARGDVGCPEAQRIGHRSERKPIRRKAVRIDIDPEFPVSNAVAPDA